MVTVLMETRRAKTVDRQSGKQPRPYSPVICGDRQPDVKQQIIPGVRHTVPVTRAVHGDQISAIIAVPRCCCMPSETHGKNGVTPIFRSFHRTASSHHHHRRLIFYNVSSFSICLCTFPCDGMNDNI